MPQPPRARVARLQARLRRRASARTQSTTSPRRPALSWCCATRSAKSWCDDLLRDAFVLYALLAAALWHVLTWHCGAGEPGPAGAVRRVGRAQGGSAAAQGGDCSHRRRRRRDGRVALLRQEGARGVGRRRRAHRAMRVTRRRRLIVSRCRMLARRALCRPGQTRLCISTRHSTACAARGARSAQAPVGGANRRARPACGVLLGLAPAPVRAREPSAPARRRAAARRPRPCGLGPDAPRRQRSGCGSEHVWGGMRVASAPRCGGVVARAAACARRAWRHVTRKIVGPRRGPRGAAMERTWHCPLSPARSRGPRRWREPSGRGGAAG